MKKLKKIQDNDKALKGDANNLSAEDLKMLNDALKSMQSREQFKEQNEEAREFFRKAIYKI
ncbi:hypothetical protein [uncultured Flavobacterium sp.]|uniref:hypothetical protein n=1 Tax=uncultured Flavobacterium sp. TaxID=165435 RepID=UPI0025D2A97C|nr:hypothetical protein [uncultured Flavobacterium sp.]